MIEYTLFVCDWADALYTTFTEPSVLSHSITRPTLTYRLMQVIFLRCARVRLKAHGHKRVCMRLDHFEDPLAAALANQALRSATPFA